MVKLTTGKGKVAVDFVPNELVGLEQPSPFISALYSYVLAKAKEEDSVKMEKAHEQTAPADDLARKVKMMSLFPNIYRGPQYHRTMSFVRTDDMDGENYVADRESNDVAKSTRRTRRPGVKKSTYTPPMKQEEPYRSPELLTKKRLS